MKLGTIRGIEIKLHYSVLLIIGLIAFGAGSISAQLFPGLFAIWELVLIGVISGVIILFSILAHELVHSFTAQRYGHVITEIELYLYGGVSKIDGEPATPGQEAKIAAAGPATSLLIGFGVFGVLYLPVAFPAILFATLLYVGPVNILLGLFNLLPAYPMDGGRLVRAALWKRRKDIVSATKTASKIGSFVGYLMMGYGLLQVFLFGILGGFWLFIIGSFLNNAAKQSYLATVVEARLGHLQASDILEMPPVGIPASLTLEDAIQEFFIPYKRRYFPVVDWSDIQGILDVEAVRKIPRETRAKTSVSKVMVPIEKIPVVDTEEEGKEVLRILQSEESEPHLVVVRDENGVFRGLIGEDTVQYALQFSDVTRHPEVSPETSLPPA